MIAKKVHDFVILSELEKCFQQLQRDKDCRAVLLSGRGKGFTSGLDLSDVSEMFSLEEEDVGRKAFHFRNLVQKYQNSISSIEIVKYSNINLSNKT